MNLSLSILGDLYLNPRKPDTRMKQALFVLFALISPSFASVTITANTPTYNFQVLPGSTRQINVGLTGGTANTVNWSVVSTTGGATATFTTPSLSSVASVSAGLPTIQVNVGPAAGNCTIPQAQSAIGTYVVTSSATVTVQAQSVDDSTQKATFLFNVCANTTTVMIAPAYRQAFQGQHVMLQSWVSGNVDETGTWSILSQPSSGDGTLADTGNRDADFKATVTGRYTLQYTSHADSSQSATAIVYVAPQPMPTYAATPESTEPRACFVDPAFTGAVYDVGAGKTYPTMQSVPSAGTWTPGTIMRVWNTDTTGTNPSTFFENFQIKNGGTATQPIMLCGIPDASGNLPIVDGANATMQAGFSTGIVGYGIITTWGGGYGSGTPYGYWQSGSAGPSYVTITGLHIKHGTPAYTYTPPGGGVPKAYVVGASCIDLRSGAYIDLGGNDLDTCTNGFFTAENTASAWANVTQLVTFTGNHIHNSGWATDQTEHQMYFQSFYGVVQGNLLDGYLGTAQGSNIKWRGVEGIFRYNFLASGPLRDFDLVENSDAAPYVSFEGYLSTQGQTNCYASEYCTGDTAGPNIIAAYQESEQKDFIYGNIILGTSAQNQIHYAEDQGSGMNDRNGTLYFFNNTLDNARTVFDTGSGAGDNSYFPQRIDARNNLLWTYGSQTEFGRYAYLIGSWTTNLMKAGTFSIQTPIMGGFYNGGTSNGWESPTTGYGCDYACPWPLVVPIDAHQFGLSNANFLTTPTLPYSQTTFAPVSGSAVSGAGTALSGMLAVMPVRWQYSVASAALVPRVNSLDIGAVDTGIPSVAPSVPVASTVATPALSLAGGTYSTTQTVSLSDATSGATIYYTIDGSTPTTNSPIYTGPLTVSSTTTVHAIAAASGYTTSGIASATYTITASKTVAATPSFSLAAGTYSTAVTVVIGDATPGATIYYTTNGSTPTTGSSVYVGPFVATASTTVQALAVASGYTNSAVASATYTISATVAAAPMFSLATGTYTSAQTVSLSDATSGAVIYYTTNGSTPTTSSLRYAGAITVSSLETIHALAVVSGYTNSAVASATYTISAPLAAAPVFSVATGTYNLAQTVSLSDATPGAAIYYTTNGSAPTTSSLRYAGAITVGSSETIRAVAVATSFANSEVASATYTISASVVASPVFNVAAGNYSSAQTVTLSDATSGAVIYYTTNGSTPTTSSLRYAGAITVSSSESIQALAVASGYTNSAVVSATYTIGISIAAAPVFSVATGSYRSAQTVSLSDATPGAVIYYTIDGSAPTINSTIYTGVITVSLSETIEAIAVAPGVMTSPVATAIYTFKTSQRALDFTVTPTGLSSQTVALGGTATYSVLITPTDGVYPGNVVFAASGLPAGATATFSPNTIPADGGAQTVTLTIQTLPVSAVNRKPLFGSGVISTALAMLLPLFGFGRLSKRNLGMTRLLCLVLLALSGAAATSVLTGCGSGGSLNGLGLQSYNVVIAPTSAGVQHTANVTLTVQ